MGNMAWASLPFRSFFMEMFYLRAAERLLIVISGLVCIVLGYGLFRLTYAKVDRSNAELVAKGGGFEVTLRNVWPGVFFAAFGMIILVSAILTQIKSSVSADGSSGNASYVTYHGGTLQVEDTRTRAANAIASIGKILSLEASRTEIKSPEIMTAISRLGTAQIDLVDVAYGEGSYDKFTDITSKSRVPAEFATVPEKDKQFFEDLRTSLKR
jgi:hypothetical protein